MTPKVPGLLFLLSLALFLAALPAPQAEGGTETLPDSVATADSLAAAGIDSTEAEEEEPASAARQSGRRFSPSYTSGYQVNRNIRTWTQGLTFGSWIGPVDISSGTTVSVTKDKTLNRDRRNRSTNLGLRYKFPNGFSVGSTVAAVRDQTDDGGRITSSNDSERFNVNGDYERELATDLTGVFRVAAGTSRDHREDPLTSNRESIGPHAEGSADFALKRVGDWSLHTSLRNSRLISTEDRTHKTTRDNNLGSDATMSWKFEVPGFDTWTLSAGRSLNRNQYPLPAGENTVRQETTSIRGGDVSLNTSASPWPRFNLSGSASYRNNNVDRDIDLQRSQESNDRAADWRINYQFPDSTSVEVRQGWAVARSLYEDPMRVNLNGDIETRSLGGSMKRPLGDHAMINMAGKYEIQSFFFDDPQKNPDDRDVLHGDFSSNVEYTPMRKIRSNVRFSFQHNQSISIDETRSGTNQTQQVYSVIPTFEFKLNDRITFREEGSVIANANVIDFNENLNRLSRSTELRSAIETRLFPRLGVNLRHAHRLLLDGSYARGEDGIRRFGKSRQDTSRDLTFQVDYSPINGVNANFRANQRLGDNISRTFQGVEARSASEFTEIEAGSRMSRALSSGLSVTLDLKRFQSWGSSNVRNNYLVGNIGVTHQF